MLQRSPSVPTNPKLQYQQRAQHGIPRAVVPPTSLPPAYLRYSPVYLERILIYDLCYVTIKNHRTVIIIKHGINSNLNVCSLLKVTYGSSLLRLELLVLVYILTKRLLRNHHFKNCDF